MVYQKIWDRARLLIYPNIARGPWGSSEGAFENSRSLYSGLERQTTKNDCGAACVEQYLRRQGIDPTDLKLMSYVDDDFFTGGTVAEDLVAMLAAAGKTAKPHQLLDNAGKVLPNAFDDLLRTSKSDVFVLVQSKNMGPQHWVLIENVTGNAVRYYDPATGQRLYGTIDEFRQRFLGVFVH